MLVINNIANKKGKIIAQFTKKFKCLVKDVGNTFCFFFERKGKKMFFDINKI